MAKKLKILVNEVQSAQNALKDFQIEHIVVKHKDSDFVHVIVLNKDKETAKEAITKAGIKIRKIRGTRHYERYGEKHEYWYPKYKCTCRHCGKQFESLVKEAVWCSAKCKSEFCKSKKLKNNG